MTEHTMDKDNLGEILSQVAYRMKEGMSTMYTALQRVAPPDQRDEDETLDKNAALLTRSFYRLRRLAGNLEEAAQLDTPPNPLLFQNDDIVGLTRLVTNQVSYAAELLGLTLTFQCAESSCIISMDAARIERMLLNLFSNAFKFTPRGGRVSVEVFVEAFQVEIHISDTGCGIPEAERDTIYDRYRYSTFPDGSPTGLGLGLPIARKIARDHGGNLTHIPSQNGGTIAVATLARKKTPKIQLQTPLWADYSGGFDRVLLELSDTLPGKAFQNKMID